MRLTATQKKLLEDIRYLTEDGEEFAYIECGKYKPNNRRTVESLVDRNLISADEVCWDVFHCKLNSI